MNWKLIISGAVSGFFAAVVIDVNAWSKTDQAFDWGLAVKRWVAGAITGATSMFGMTAVPE